MGFINKRIFRFRYPVALIEPAYYWLDAKPKLLKWVLSFAPISILLFEIRFLRKLFFKISINERIIENPFVLSRLPASPAKILDFGATSSWLSLNLASLGHKVSAFDLRPYEFSHPNINFTQGDIFSAELPSNEFDAIIIVSTLEHVGLDINKYGENADGRALSVLSKTLKPNGRLFLTVPYGKPVITSSHRVYSYDILKNIIPSGLSVKEAVYYKKNSPIVWSEVSEKEASVANSLKESMAVACFVLEKIG